MEMPQIENSNTASLFRHIEAVIVALHRLTLKLRHEAKLSGTPDERNFQLVRLLAQHLLKEGARLERIAARLETQFVKVMRKRAN